jgi:hypothetical protein
VVRVEAHTPRFKPVRLDQLVEKLRGTLVQVAKAAAFILIKLHVRVTCQHFSNNNSRIGVRHLATIISRINKPLGTIDVNRGCSPTERPEKSAIEQWREFSA